MVQGPEKKKKEDQNARWRDLLAKIRKKGRVAARCKGVGGKEPGQELGFWRLGGLGPVWATLSRLKNIYFLLQNNLAINF